MRTFARMLSISLIAALMASLVGCGDKDRNPDPPKKPVGQNNVFGDTVAAKDRVRNDVNKAMDENQKKLDEAMRKQDKEVSDSATPAAAEQ